MFRPVPSNPSYQVSDTGVVLSKCGKPMAPNLSGNGYFYVVLHHSEHGRKRRTVHSLVAEAFIGPRPGSDYEVRHLNGIPTDNRAENLAYGTHSDNMQDMLRHGNNHQVNKTHCPQGHPYVPGNIYLSIRRDGVKNRQCRTCKLENGNRRARERRLRANGGILRRPKTHCKRGHEFTPENTYQQKSGRGCRTCRSTYVARWHQERKQVAS